MLSRSVVCARRCAALVLMLPLASSCGGGGGGDGTIPPPTLNAVFTPSATAQTANLVKLLRAGSSGTRITLHAVVFGPTTSADIFSWSFDIVIGDPTVARYVPGSIQEGTALTPCPSQTVQALATQTVAGDGTTRVVVGVTKLGACDGNAVTGSQASIATLAFDVLKAGTTTLTFAASPAPEAKDPSPARIATIVFDTASATLAGQ